MAVCALAVPACVGELSLPQPPDVQGSASAYDAPTAPLTADTAETLLDGIAARRQQLAEVDDLSSLATTLVTIDRSITAEQNDDGHVIARIDGIPITTDAVIDVSADCPGWDDEPSVDSVALTIVVQDSAVVPTTWGALVDCRFAASPAGIESSVSLSADVIAYLPNLLLANAPRIIYVAFEITDFERNGAAQPTWSGDFRLVDETLEVRADLRDIGHVIGLVGDDAAVIGVRAANGEWACFMEERRCDSVDSSSDSVSY